jgi:hypothetical protein
MNRSGRPSKREVDTATKERKRLQKRAEDLAAWGTPIPFKLQEQLKAALQNETDMVVRRKRGQEG